MTGINATTFNPYLVPSSSTKIRGEEEKSPVAGVSEQGETEKDGSLKINVSSASTDAAAAQAASDPVEQLKKQIADTQKLLTQQRAQLAGTQRGQANAEQKAQQVMNLQTQIMGTNATLQTLQAALVQATSGVDTHA
ncbi:hypothetical protein M1B35_09670 [Pseudomonas sp. MAFF 302046]|jgi:hypothetical protein|uniref:Uncharacterized protein n=1 Tax=Pseudomonas morbosilactucae TaxID=2938197 RepID=A0ABT0JEQ7_9PSED|nr:hypothetical protein [Pseudomonas morbosilactucae]MCK9814391.1 hypothetical protein [Pseudomonas morbosilactucae]